MPALLKPLRGGRSIVLDKPIILVGRHPDCDIVLTDSGKLSRKHCCIALVDDRVIVRDLDSMNGVWLNGSRIQDSVEVKSGDTVAIGDVPFQLVRRVGGSDPVVENRRAPSRDDHTAADSELMEPGVRAVLKQPRRVDEAGAGDAVRFGSDFAIPLSSGAESGDEFIPLAERDDSHG